MSESFVYPEGFPKGTLVEFGDITFPVKGVVVDPDDEIVGQPLKGLYPRDKSQVWVFWEESHKRHVERFDHLDDEVSGPAHGSWFRTSDLRKV